MRSRINCSRRTESLEVVLFMFRNKESVQSNKQIIFEMEQIRIFEAKINNVAKMIVEISYE